MESASRYAELLWICWRRSHGQPTKGGRHSRGEEGLMRQPVSHKRRRNWTDYFGITQTMENGQGENKSKLRFRSSGFSFRIKIYILPFFNIQESRVVSQQSALLGGWWWWWSHRRMDFEEWQRWFTLRKLDAELKGQIWQDCATGGETEKKKFRQLSFFFPLSLTSSLFF
jgi:hypothetical protein